MNPLYHKKTGRVITRPADFLQMAIVLNNL